MKSQFCSNDDEAGHNLQSVSNSFIHSVHIIKQEYYIHWKLNEFIDLGLQKHQMIIMTMMTLLSQVFSIAKISVKNVYIYIFTYFYKYIIDSNGWLVGWCLWNSRIFVKYWLNELEKKSARHWKNQPRKININETIYA